jgi:hypothetical protein
MTGVAFLVDEEPRPDMQLILQANEPHPTLRIAHQALHMLQSWHATAPLRFAQGRWQQQGDIFHQRIRCQRHFTKLLTNDRHVSLLQLPESRYPPVQLGPHRAQVDLHFRHLCFLQFGLYTHTAPKPRTTLMKR